MRCPSCKQQTKDRVIDSRLTNAGVAIRRRRECTVCGQRFTTKERIEATDRITVLKKDGSRVPFDPLKILNGMRHACYKRPVSQEQLQAAAAEVEDQLCREFEREIPSRFIGSRVARKLRALDQVAYVRFACVYGELQDLDDVLEEIEQAREQGPEVPGQQQLF